MLSAEEKVVMVALQEFEGRIRELMDFLADKKSITRSEKEWLQSLLSPLKADIRAAAKRGKVSDDLAPQNQAEYAYFSGAMLSASANFSVATNSHPINSDWLSCLYNIDMDIRQLLCQLEERA